MTERLSIDQLRALQVKLKANKYGAKAITVNGVRFDSMAEADRYQELRLLEGAGQIRNLEPHPSLPITINGIKVCTVEGDAGYFEGEKRVIEDTKGRDTAVSKLKRKLVRAQWPNIEWRVVKA